MSHSEEKKNTFKKDEREYTRFSTCYEDESLVLSEKDSPL